MKARPYVSSGSLDNGKIRVKVEICHIHIIFQQSNNPLRNDILRCVLYPLELQECENRLLPVLSANLDHSMGKYPSFLLKARLV
jgi:hypothetical protein